MESCLMVVWPGPPKISWCAAVPVASRRDRHPSTCVHGRRVPVTESPRPEAMAVAFAVRRVHCADAVDDLHV